MKLVTLERVLAIEVGDLAAALLHTEPTDILAGHYVSFGRALDGESAEISVWEDKESYLRNGKRTTYKVNLKVTLTKLKPDEHE